MWETSTQHPPLTKLGGTLGGRSSREGEICPKGRCFTLQTLIKSYLRNESFRPHRGEMCIPSHVCNTHSWATTTQNDARNRILHTAWSTSRPQYTGTTNACALGTGSRRLARGDSDRGGERRGQEGRQTQEKATVFHLKTLSIQGAVDFRRRPYTEVRQSKAPERKFSRVCKVFAGVKRWLHGAPPLQQPGLNARCKELRVRAGSWVGGGGRGERAAAADPGARQNAERAGSLRRAQARAASSRPQLPPTGFGALLPAPFFSREGRAVARGPFASSPPRRRIVSRGREAGRAGRSRASPPQHSAQQRSVETLGR